MMSDESRNGRHRRSRRASTNSDSDNRGRRQSHRRSQHEDFTGHEGRKRARSRSRDAPRKRRSVSRDYEDRRQDTREDRYKNDRRDRKRRSRSDDRRRRRSRSPEPFKRSNRPLPSQKDAFQNEDLAVVKAEPVMEKQKPNFSKSGRLAAASNTVQTAGQSIILKYHEPSEARKPAAKDRWRMYVFKGEEIVDTLELAEQSCWLFGREAAVVDVLIEHSSCSKQHAVIQFRYLERRNEFGDKKGKVRPYVLDLESANGTTVNEDPIPGAQYVELRDKDVVKFGHSSREYVMQLPPSG